MRSASLGARSAIALLSAPILLLACIASGASAQDSAPDARLRLMKIPAAHGPDSDLGVRLRVVNAGERPIDGFNITVAASGIIRNRTDLHDSFEDPPIADALTLDFTDRRLPPGQHTTVPIDIPVSELSLGFEDGVHALQLSLLTEDSTFPIDTLTTQLMSYSTDPDNPLKVVPLLPLNEVPARAPDGTYPVDVSGENWMEEAVADDGWLTALVGALDTVTAAPSSPEPERERQPGRGPRRRQPQPEPPPEPLQLGLAPTPRLIDELAEMANGYTRSSGARREVPRDAPRAQAAATVLDSLRNVAGRDSIQPVLVPYSYPDVPTIVEELSPAELGDQLLEGSTTLGDRLRLPVNRGWVYPPNGRLDLDSLEALQAAGVTEGVFFGEISLRPLDEDEGLGCPVPDLSFACPVSVETNAGEPILGYVEDGSVQERLSELAAPGAGRLEIQRVLAETAMVHAEQPGITERVLHFNIPSIWHPRPAIAKTFFRSLQAAPWMTTRTPSKAAAEAEGTRRAVVDQVALPAPPDEGFFGDIVEAEGAVESLANFIASSEQRRRIRRLRSNILVAQDRLLWDLDLDLAASYAHEARDEAREELNKVTLGVPDETTFTSRAGSLDVSLFNQTDYPIDVRVVFQSLDMEFSPETFERTFPPGTTRLSIQAEAQTSGTFPIEVRVETEDGYVVAVQSVQVRSTEFNVVALALTLGAVAFLILFYVGKALRRRRRPAEASSS